MKRKKLVIISHTEHYLTDKGFLVGWGSTVNEINYLADYWEEVVHVACFYKEPAPASALPYSKLNVQFAGIPPFGGKTLKSKLLIFTKIPKIVQQVHKAIDGATEVQLRLPTSMGLFLLPLFAFYWSRKFVFWVKYAGNWNHQSAPFSYRFQKWFLFQNYAKCKVTINGFWEGQPSHCLSFENPCLTAEDIEKGIVVAQEKCFNAPFVFCFVGRLDENKGMAHVVRALQELPAASIQQVHFVGDGYEKEQYQKQLAFLQEKVVFHGFLAQEEVHAVLEQSHFLLLPSKSEGFPKVIAEAACYGVVPVVSDVGSIPHYVDASNGFVWAIEGDVSYEYFLQDVVLLPEKDLDEKRKAILPLAKKFTFVAYMEKLNALILK